MMDSFVSFRKDRPDVLEDFIKACALAGFAEQVVLKGGMNLQVAANHYSSKVEARPTIDIDLHINSPEVWENLIYEIPRMISLNSEKRFNYEVVYRRGFDRNPNSDSIKVVGDGYKFDVDMNISSYQPKAEEYELGWLPGYSLNDMLSDKLRVMFSPRIYRRVKDMYDLYLLSYLKDTELEPLVLNIGEKLEVRIRELHFPDVDKLRHAYSKLERLTDKPSFDEVYRRAFMFGAVIMQSVVAGADSNLIWDYKQGIWKGNIELYKLMSYSDMTGVLCEEFALANYYGYSTLPNQPVVLAQDVVEGVDLGYLRIVKQSPLSYKYTGDIREDLRLVWVERAICELIIKEFEERFIYESLEELRAEKGDFAGLLGVARDLGCYDRAKEMIDNLDNWITDFYELV